MQQRIEVLALNQVDAATYQRQTNGAQVQRIANNFNEAKLGMLVVSARDGQYFIVDGTHRVAALRRLGFESAMFIVLQGLTYQQEADYFRRQNENTRGLTLYTRFKAGLESGDETCVAINAVVEKNGFAIGTTSRYFDTITAIFALVTIYDSYGVDVLDQTLRLIRATWEGNPTAKNREFLVSVAEFVHRFGPCDFAQRLARVSLAAIWQEFLVWAQYQNRATANREMRVALCRVLVRHYNKGLASGSRKRLVMEG
jgi:hypothetical protein